MHVCTYVRMYICMCDLYVFGKGHWRPLHPLQLVGVSLQSSNHQSLCGGRAQPWDCLDTNTEAADWTVIAVLTAARAMMWNHCSMNSVSRQWILLIVCFVYIGGVGAALSEQVPPDTASLSAPFWDLVLHHLMCTNFLLCFDTPIYAQGLLFVNWCGWLLSNQTVM